MTTSITEAKTETKKLFIGRIFSKIGIYLSIPLCINAGTIPITYGINHTIPSEEKTVVFANGQTLDFIVYTPIILEQNIRGRQVTWISDATYQEVVDYLINPEYENVVFFGHGSRSIYETRDDNFISGYTILIHDIPKKNEVLQYTCGELGSSPALREVLVSDPHQWYGFEKKVSFNTLYAAAWERFIMTAFSKSEIQ